MLRRIELEKFKCFARLDLPIGRLTLLSGTNASGKSSILQALVLLHQTMRDDEWSTRLLLNGLALSLGTLADVVDKETGRRAFAFALSFENADAYDDDVIRWDFEGEDREAMSVPVKAVDWNGQRIESPDLLRHLFPSESRRETQFSTVAMSAADAEDALQLPRNGASTLRRLSYIAADRTGPREIYPLSDHARAETVGARGEQAVGLLHVLRDDPVRAPLCIPDVPSLLFQQTQAALRRFFPGCSIVVTPVPHTNGVTLGIRTSDATDFHRPQHVGFGLSHVLPILVAALTAREGDLLIVENPEVHLHPAGQALMGRFLSEVAASGVQVLLETHSDHVLNGVRRAVRDAVIPGQDVALHFFRGRGSDGAQVMSPRIDASGNVDFWPEGFFDQFDKDTAALAGWDS